MNVDIHLAAMQQVAVPTNSFLGNFGSAGIGVVLLYTGHQMAKHGKWPYSKEAKNFDWHTLVSMAIGLAGVTFLLGATGIFALIPQFFQSTAKGLSNVFIIKDIGMGGICVIVAVFLWVNSFDQTKNIKWGAACAIIFPLGGGIWSQLPVLANNTIVEAMSAVTA